MHSAVVVATSYAVSVKYLSRASKETAKLESWYYGNKNKEREGEGVRRKTSETERNNSTGLNGTAAE